MNARILTSLLLLLPLAAVAEDAPPPAAAAEPAARTASAQPPGGAKVISGMSILGNQEAPKSLVIVPWKSSQLGDAIAIESMLDDSRRPVDKEVFMRELGYYEISSK
jgi:hypothetical protein